MSDPRILTPEQLDFIWERCNDPTWSSVLMCCDIPALLTSHAALTEQLTAKDRLIHEYQDKEAQE